MMKKWTLLFMLLTLGLLTACGNKGSDQTWEEPPEMMIESGQDITATIETTLGDIEIELFTEDAPNTVNNFVFLAKENFYNDVVFHRVIEDFMIQTGDPLGNGTGGPGYVFADELPSPYSYEKGIVAMANYDPDTNGSQFFICSGAECEGLNKEPNYTIFGRVTKGIEVVEDIASVEVEPNDAGEPSRPVEEIKMKQVIIEES